MAKLVGVSKRTFSEWMRDGGAAPVAMEAVLTMLSMIPSEDVLKIIENWRLNKPSSENSNQDRGVANGQNSA
jgi:predicted site-specific integrase-resolvase